MKNANIYTITHKFFIPPLNTFHKPIVTGANQHNLPFKKDNSQDNISSKNPYYAELTALYWLWKNDHSSIIGIEHYHRFWYKDKLISRKEVEELLSQYQIIVPKALNLNQSIYNQYADCHYINDLNLACATIYQYDNNFKNAIIKTLNQNYIYPYNMLITTKDIYDDYLSFLFSILFELESKIPFFSYSSYNQRVFGFLSERIFNIYLKKKNLAYFEYPVQDTMKQKEQIKKRKKVLEEIRKDHNNNEKKYFSK